MIAKLVTYGWIILLGIVELNKFAPDSWNPFLAVGALGLIGISVYFLVKEPQE